MLKRCLLTHICLASGMLLAACGGPAQSPTETEDVVSIEARLAQDNGGYELTDESLAVAPEDTELPNDFDFDRDRVAGMDRLLDETPDMPRGLPETSSEGRTMPEVDRPAERPADCPRFGTRGRWKQVAKGYGVYRGLIADRDGNVVGFLKGVYGRGHFIGKAIHRGGRAWALLKGIYRGGHFKGRWKSNLGHRGTLHGTYATGVFRGVFSVLCPSDCENECDGNWRRTDDGGCHCIRRCDDGRHLDLCPAQERVCERVDQPQSGDRTDVRQRDNAGVESEPDVARCHLRCVAPACVADRLPPQDRSAESDRNSSGAR